MTKKSKFINSIPLFVGISVILSIPQCYSQQAKVLLNDKILEFSNDNVLRHASWGISVMDVAAGKEVASYNSQQSLIPASTMKVVSTAACLSLLGPHHRFKTFLECSGTIGSDGILRGDLYIRGGGDPTLGSERFIGTDMETLFKRWYDAIKKADINKIEGKLIADDTYFEGQMAPGSRSWDDMGNYYGAACASLSLHENYYTAYIKAGIAKGQKAEIIRTDPFLPGVQLQSYLQTSGSETGDNVIIYGAACAPFVQFEGTVPLGVKEFPVKGSIPDPPYTLAFLFRKYLMKQGIEITLPANSVRRMKLEGLEPETKRFNIYTNLSPELQEIILPTNLYSINIFAEILLLNTGKSVNGKGSYDSGIQAVTAFWKSRGIDLSGFNMEDGSGLSRKNLVTTEQLARMLAVFVKDSTYIIFRSTLPLASRSGSLKSLFKGTSAEDKLIAKSGYMTAVRAYAGYVMNKSNRLLSFAVIVNHYEGSHSDMKKKLEELMVAIADTK